MRVKRNIRLIGVGLTVALLFCAATVSMLCASNPALRFLVYQTGLRGLSSSDYRKSRITSAHRTDIPIDAYETTDVRKPGPAIILIHGLTPLGANHPAVVRTASSLAVSTGRMVLVPDIAFLRELKLPSDAAAQMIAIVQAARHAAKVGQYDLVGSCVGGSFALEAVSRLPPELQPRRFLLLGGISTLASIVRFYNRPLPTQGRTDFYGRAVLYANFGASDNQQVFAYLRSTVPGGTDEARACHDLGVALCARILSSELTLPPLAEPVHPVPNLYNPEVRKPFFPLQLVHFSDDSFVPPTESQMIKRDFEAIDGRADLLIVGGIGHSGQGTVPLRDFRELVRILGEFLE
jgi:pimeloyl-ACP methyl ester carboxylesterase